MKIYKRIILLIIIVLFIQVLLTGCRISFNVGFSDKPIKTQTIQEEDYITSQFDTNEIEKELDIFINKLKSTEDETEINEALEMFQNNIDLIGSNIYFANETGQFYMYPNIELPEDYDARTRQWYIQAMKDEIYISEVYIDYATEDGMITIAKKVTIDDSIIGVVGLDVPIQKNK